MKNIRLYLMVLASFIVITTTQAQTKTVEDLQAELAALSDKFEALDAELISDKEKSATKAFYTPSVFGSALTYYNLSTYSGEQRFAVRNAHIGVTGNASESVTYQIQVNFHNLASVSVLDSWIKYRYSRFDVTLGQQFIHLTADFDRAGPKSSLFTTRSYGNVFIPAYTNGTTLKSLGNRDIGLYANYTLGCDLPITLSAGVFNGAGINQISWSDHVNILARLQIGRSKGLSAGASAYTGSTPYLQDISIYSAEVRYVSNSLFVEANLQNQQLREDEDSLYQSMSTGLIQGYYTFKLKANKAFESIAPTLRYDFGNNVNYSNSSSSTVERVDVERITAQLNFNFNGAKIRSRFSIGYEKIIPEQVPSDIADNTLFQDKFTVGMTVAF
ncbi:MAG: porin [Rikenellaceae bacterium]